MILKVRVRRGVVLALLAAAPSVGSGEAKATLEIRARDSRTGLPVRARVTHASHTEVAASAPAETPARLSLEAGRRQLEVLAEGYKPQRVPLELRAGEPLDLTVWLDPEAADAPAPDAARPGQALVHGLVYDAASGLPLADVRVRLEASHVESVSDGSGAFALELPAPPAAEGELPAADVLVASRPGFAATRVAEVLLTEGATRVSVGLAPGAGTRVQGVAHKLRRESREPALAEGSFQGPQPPRAAPAPAARAGALPDSIRVGFDCSCASCASVQVFSLDSYVRLGLDDEWIASWHEESLAAGAIAYRSYGAWHVAHPRAASYDICSTTCCQVIDPLDSSARVDAAVARTAGQAVVDAAGEPLFAEYSAENNGAYCPDGFAGRPAHDWPCLADPVDAGTAWNGHGRGMCQWGTERWAAREGRDYRWIVDHYYNDNGRPSGRRSGTLAPSARVGFSLELRPATARVKRGAAAHFELWVTPRDGFDGPVALRVAGAPGGATTGLSLPVIRTSGMSGLSVATSRTGGTGTFRLTVTGESGALSQVAEASLTVSR